MAEKKYISGAAFEKWVKRMCRQFDDNKLSTYVINGDTLYVYLRSKAGKAKRNPKDTWKEDIGIAYAWARCTGQPEYYVKEVYTPKIGDFVNVDFVCGSTAYLKFIAEGVDNY